MDDLDSGFHRKGTGWHGSKSGYAHHHFWVPAQRNRKVRVGAWRPTLPATGFYLVEVKIPRWHATTRRALYKIKTVDGWAKRRGNQRKFRGRWMVLGVYQLSKNPLVILTDKTGERRSLRRRVAFDALRFTPVSAPIGNPDQQP